jgi:hypothetical protein
MKFFFFKILPPPNICILGSKFGAKSVPSPCHKKYEIFFQNFTASKFFAYWATLGYFGLPWAILGYFGLPWATLGYLGLF